MKAYVVKLTKLSDNQNSLRTNEVEGISDELPVIGRPFRLVANPIVEGADARLVITSEIKNIEKTENQYVFNTLNSQYKLEILSEEQI